MAWAPPLAYNAIEVSSQNAKNGNRDLVLCNETGPFVDLDIARTRRFGQRMAA